MIYPALSPMQVQGTHLLVEGLIIARQMIIFAHPLNCRANRNNAIKKFNNISLSFALLSFLALEKIQEFICKMCLQLFLFQAKGKYRFASKSSRPLN